MHEMFLTFAIVENKLFDRCAISISNEYDDEQQSSPSPSLDTLIISLVAFSSHEL